MIYIHKFETRDDYKKFIKDSYIEPHVSVTKYKNSGGVISFLGSIDNEGANDSGETFTYAYMQNSDYFYLTNVNMSEVSQYDDENITITVDGVVYGDPFQFNENEIGWENENSACVTSSLEPSVGDVAKCFSFEASTPAITSSRNFEVGEVFSHGPFAVTVLEIIDKEQPSEEINKVSYNFKYVQPLTFDILSDGTIQWVCHKAGDFQYEPITIKYKKNDEEWVTITSDYQYHNPPTINVNTGDVLMFTGTKAPGSDFGWNSFRSSATYNVSGDINSLLNDGNFDTPVSLSSSVFFRLFGDGLISAENLILSDTLSDNCYNSMFYGCSSLTTAPSTLPATTLSNYCYYSMFYNCSSLTTAPELPATTLANNCYYEMFRGCTSLTTAPELPATTLTESCYSQMFYGCTSLTTAPELPATTLAEYCYLHMFNGCTSLTTAPELPATTLADSCYNEMFSGCTSLNYIKCLATDITANGCTNNWVNGVASSGTFVKNPNMSSWTTGANGIPTNWTVQDAS